MKKIHSILKYLYRSLVQYCFKLFYGSIFYEKTNSFNENIIIDIVDNESILNPNNSNYNVYKIINGRIYTDFVENVAVINQKKILNNVSYQQVHGQLKDTRFNSTIFKGTPNFKKKINGKVLSLTQGASGHKNYFHWLFDILPKIKIFSEIHDLKSLDYFYLSKLEIFQQKTLKILGLEKIKILDANRYRHVQADELYAVEHPWYTKGYILEEAKYLPPWIIHWIRDSFLTSALKFDANEKIFIDRTESKFNHCQLQNNDEIKEFLINKGFSVYKVGELTFEEQVYLFKNAKIIIGAHGAAFANLAFCSANTKIIEIKPIFHPNFVSKSIGEINNLDLHYIETPKLQTKSVLGDIHIDIKILNKYL